MRYRLAATLASVMPTALQAFTGLISNTCVQARGAGVVRGQRAGKRGGKAIDVGQLIRTCGSVKTDGDAHCCFQHRGSLLCG